MKREQSKHPAKNLFKRRHSAMSALEVMVALTLLLTTLSLSLPLIIRHGQLLIEQRHYRMALDELSNQLDRITALPADDVPQALQQLSLSPFAATRLPSAKLNAEVASEDIGQHVTMRLTWNESHAQSVSMTGWIFPRSAPSTNKRNGGP